MKGSGATESVPDATLKRLGDYTLSMTSPEPFDTELVVPFSLEDAQESAATARVAISYFWPYLMESEHGLPAWPYQAGEALAETGGPVLSLVAVKKGVRHW